MSEATLSADANGAAPMQTISGAMSSVAEAARHGSEEIAAGVRGAVPALGGFLSRMTYSTFYALSYGVVFPTMLVVRAIPRDNAFVHGLIDGGLAARDAVYGRHGEAAHPAVEPPAAEAADEPAESSPKPRNKRKPRRLDQPPA